MAHVKSRSIEIDGKHYLVSDGNGIIGGPYSSGRAADLASMEASRVVGRAPIGEYRKFLDSKIDVGNLFRQTPISQPRREITDEEFNARFNQKSREYREQLQGVTVPEEPKPEKGSIFDWFISTAGGHTPTGLLDQAKEDFVPSIAGNPLTEVGVYNLEHKTEHLIGGEGKSKKPLYDNRAYLAPDAATAFLKMQEAYGKSIPLDSAYRDVAHNTAIKGAKDSKHMAGLSIDVNNYDALIWMLKNGMKYGWFFPNYVFRGKKNQYHFNYIGSQ
jgi:hypothetical protein